MRASRCFSLLLVVSAVLLSNNKVSAQCDRVGKVTSVQPGCGITIMDLDNGDELRVVDGTSVLTGGEVVSFHSESALLPAGCPSGNLPVVAFTCLSSSLPCHAQFGHVADATDALGLTFNASVYNPLTQNCVWDFGDGNFANGSSVHHVYATHGNYTVCLKVWDALGCSDYHCETIMVGNQVLASCGYQAKVTAVNTLLAGKLIATVDPGIQVTSVKWYTDKSPQILSTAISFTAPLPFYGTYLVCADYETLNPANGATCSNTDCKQLTVAEPGVCLNPPMVNPTFNCQSVNVPVCGCDGLSYPNECEAMASGLASWWAGSCNLIYGSSQAEMQTNILSGTLDGGFYVQFINKSTGDYAFLQLDYGDGTPINTSVMLDTVVHYYTHAGIYRTTLSVWKDNTYVSTYTKMLVTDASNLNPASLPPGTDYVLPGDANNDQKANVYDLLSLGVGYSANGAPRPFANPNWHPQFGPNWSDNLGGLNFKHLDCDGNGAIHDFDVDVIAANYSPIDTASIPVVPEMPQLRVKFEQDTIVVNPDNPVPISIDADVEVGSASLPALGLYGLAYTLQYPEYVEHDPDTYYINDFFGTDNHVMSLRKDNYARQQLDMGFVRKDHQNTAGYGRIAKVSFKADFIIVVDIVAREASKIKPFTVRPKGLKGIDNAGNPKGLTIPVHQDTVWIKLLSPTTKTNEARPDQTVYLYPNPAQDEAAIYTGNLHVAQIEVFNAMGQRMQEVLPSGQMFTHLDVKGWNKGIYTVQVRTDQGLTSKRLVVD